MRFYGEDLRLKKPVRRTGSLLVFNKACELCKNVSRKGSPTNPNSGSNRHCMLLTCTIGDQKLPPSNPSDNVAELNETSGQNYIEEDQVSLISIYDVSNITLQSFQTYSNETTSNRQTHSYQKDMSLRYTS